MNIDIDDLTLISSRISHETKSIDRITTQTSEVSQAGEYIRRLSAVVAEVRSLASDTSKAVSTITTLITELKSIAGTSSIIAGPRLQMRRDHYGQCGR